MVVVDAFAADYSFGDVVVDVVVVEAVVVDVVGNRVLVDAVDAIPSSFPLISSLYFIRIYQRRRVRLEASARRCVPFAPLCHHARLAHRIRLPAQRRRLYRAYLLFTIVGELYTE